MHIVPFLSGEMIWHSWLLLLIVMFLPVSLPVLPLLPGEIIWHSWLLLFVVLFLPVFFTCSSCSIWGNNLALLDAITGSPVSTCFITCNSCSIWGNNLTLLATVTGSPVASFCCILQFVCTKH